MVNCKKQQNKYDTVSGFTLIKKYPQLEVFNLIMNTIFICSIAGQLCHQQH